MNIEIQQRACEFLKLFDSKWDEDRLGIFEPIPFKGDENMLVDATGRAVMDQEEGEDQLLVAPGAAANDKAAGNAQRQKHQQEQAAQSKQLDLDSLLVLGDTPAIGTT